MNINLSDIYPLSEFQRNAKSHIKRINKTGRPEVLTVNGKAEAVVIGRDEYDDLLAAWDKFDTMQSIAEGLEDIEKGRLYSAKQVHSELFDGKK